MLSEREKAVHLLNRAGFGPRPGDVDRVLRLGLKEYVEEQLNPERIDDSQGKKWDGVFEILAKDPTELWWAYRSRPRDILNQMKAYKLIRAIHSRRQLQEVLVDFWFNHFNVFLGKDDVPFLAPEYENKLLRPNVLGRFGDLLLGIARHPAMLIYLDNALSSGPAGINENYARELMELHTLGVDGGYAQPDVEEVARCFSGWTVDRGRMTFAFQDVIHDPGDKQVLGRRIASGGQSEGEAILKMLSEHQSAARFLATKLVRRFVSDNPPESLVDRATKVFANTQGEIREVVRTILMSDEFFEPAAYRAKVKSPFEVVVSSVRAVDARSKAVPSPSPGSDGMAMYQRRVAAVSGVGNDARAYMSLVEVMENMGQFLYQIEAPTGYSEDSSKWLNGVTVLSRFRFAVALAGNEIPGIIVDSARLENISPAADLGLPAAEALKDIAVALGSPEFQHR